MTQPSAVQIQRKYYEDTAAHYDSMHANEGDSDEAIGNFVHGILRMLDVRSVLDVGAATGRGLHKIKAALPDAFVCGIEPVAGLIEQAQKNGSTCSGPMLRASGEALPFRDASFDAGGDSRCFTTSRTRMRLSKRCCESPERLFFCATAIDFDNCRCRCDSSK